MSLVCGNFFLGFFCCLKDPWAEETAATTEATAAKAATAATATAATATGANAALAATAATTAKKIPSASFFTSVETKILVLLSAFLGRFGVSCMLEFYLFN